ncbi:MAG: class I SAM-dependent methyltransferase [Bdellovibrionota bacterium]
MKTKKPGANEGFVPTLNQMGYMTSSLDPFSKAFVEYCKSNPSPKSALEIGAAYGIATLEALKTGRAVVANDLDPNHLEILKAQAAELGLSEKLTLAPGAFPGELNFARESLSAVLACRILHFLEGPVIEEGLRRAFDWIEKGGKIFIVCETPYTQRFQSFIPIYEANKKARDPWPGLVPNSFQYTDHTAQDIPKVLHWMDEEVLNRVLRNAGFKVEEIRMIPRPDFPSWVRLDGRESVGAIAVK